MVHEVITIAIGQCGIQTMKPVWDLYCLEHQISYNGGSLVDIDNRGIETFFRESDCGRYVPRALMADMEPDVTDAILMSKQKNLFDPITLITGMESAYGCFSAGYCKRSTHLCGLVLQQFRSMVEQCDGLNSILVYHSLGGGTGSGMACKLLEDIRQHSKVVLVDFAVHTSPTLSTSTTEPYNNVLYSACEAREKLADVSFVMDNESMYKFIPKEEENVTYAKINSLIAYLSSGITSSIRYDGKLNNNLHDFCTNLIPWEGVHYVTGGVWPLFGSRNRNPNISAHDLILLSCEKNKAFCAIDNEIDKYIACSLNFRGPTSSGEIYQTLQKVKEKNMIEFLDWVPTGFKVGCCQYPFVVLPDKLFAQSKYSLVKISNSTGIAEKFKLLTTNYQLLSKSGAFKHWYYEFGLEDTEYEVAEEFLSTLISTYKALAPGGEEDAGGE